MWKFVNISVVLFILMKPAKILTALHSSLAYQHSGSSLPSNASITQLEDVPNLWDLVDTDSMREKYSNAYNWLATAAMINYSINPTVDLLLKKVQEDLVLYNRTEFPAPILDIRVPDAVFTVAAIFSKLRISGGETITRHGDCLAILKSNGEILLDIPLRVNYGFASGMLRIDLGGLQIDAPLSGNLTRPAIYHIGLTIFPILPTLRLPQITTLELRDNGYIDVELQDWRETVAFILTFLILFVVIAVFFITLLIVTCCLVFRMRRMDRELKEYKQTGTQKEFVNNN